MNKYKRGDSKWEFLNFKNNTIKFADSDSLKWFAISMAVVYTGIVAILIVVSKFYL